VRELSLGSSGWINKRLSRNTYSGSSNTSTQAARWRSHKSNTRVSRAFSNTKFAESQEIPLPHRNEQRAIAHILGTLDDKIELNWRMNETLGTMARALFKSWFVDFDPVRGKAEGRDAGPPQAPRRSFPHSPRRLRNRRDSGGVDDQSIGDLANVVGGTTPSTKEQSYWEGGVHAWATPKDLSALSVLSYSIPSGESPTRACRKSDPDCYPREPFYCRREPRLATWPSRRFRSRSIRASSR